MFDFDYNNYDDHKVGIFFMLMNKVIENVEFVLSEPKN